MSEHNRKNVQSSSTSLVMIAMIVAIFIIAWFSDARGQTSNVEIVRGSVVENPRSNDKLPQIIRSNDLPATDQNLPQIVRGK